ncbi:hypothetical protein [Spirosoma sp. KNUC1025]|uniref:hypothetical protein n=1 Tax=Spirosoma sp. KNUC1025 TaxID=2894082 RepID=UPI003868087B|nr:hypothetical protein LN737_19110 [Spirosoma sp. KNUC1025]
MHTLLVKIKAIAAQNQEGFTITIPACEFVKSGYVIAMIDTQNSFGDAGLIRVIEVATGTTGVMGGWAEDGLFYWDAVYIVHDRQTAIQLGRDNEQVAIYHLDTNELIYL